MNGGCQHLLVTLAFLGNAIASSAAYAGSWDGVWTGKLDDKVTVSVQIANDRAVSYKILGTPIGIKFSKVSDSSIQFGDPDHYSMQLTRTGEVTAVASYYGRHGYSKINLNRNSH